MTYEVPFLGYVMFKPCYSLFCENLRFFAKYVGQYRLSVDSVCLYVFDERHTVSWLPDVEKVLFLCENLGSWKAITYFVSEFLNAIGYLVSEFLSCHSTNPKTESLMYIQIRIRIEIFQNYANMTFFAKILVRGRRLDIQFRNFSTWLDI